MGTYDPLLVTHYPLPKTINREGVQNGGVQEFRMFSSILLVHSSQLGLL
jgi:hypothetical protein